MDSEEEEAAAAAVRPSGSGIYAGAAPSRPPVCLFS